MYWVYFVTNQYAEECFTLPFGSVTTIREPQPSKEPEEAPQEEQREELILDLTKEDLEKAGYEIRKKPWMETQDSQLIFLRDKKKLDWVEIAQKIEGRNSKMCYSRYRRLQCRTKNVWSQAQDYRLIKLVQQHGQDWILLAEFISNRTYKQIKQRYLNYLHPNINKEKWILDEDFKLVNLINQHGLQWKIIERYFQGRTQNQLKNRYFGRLKRISDKKNHRNQDQGKVNEVGEQNLE